MYASFWALTLTSNSITVGLAPSRGLISTVGPKPYRDPRHRAGQGRADRDRVPRTQREVRAGEISLAPAGQISPCGDSSHPYA